MDWRAYLISAPLPGDRTGGRSEAQATFSGESAPACLASQSRPFEEDDDDGDKTKPGELERRCRWLQ